MIWMSFSVFNMHLLHLFFLFIIKDIFYINLMRLTKIHITYSKISYILATIKNLINSQQKNFLILFLLHFSSEINL